MPPNGIRQARGVAAGGSQTASSVTVPGRAPERARNIPVWNRASSRWSTYHPGPSSVSDAMKRNVCGLAEATVPPGLHFAQSGHLSAPMDSGYRIAVFPAHGTVTIGKRTSATGSGHAQFSYANVHANEPSGVFSSVAVTSKSAPNVSLPRQETTVLPPTSRTSTLFMFEGAATFIALLDEPNSSAIILNESSASGWPGIATPAPARLEAAAAKSTLNIIIRISTLLP